MFIMTALKDIPLLSLHLSVELGGAGYGNSLVLNTSFETASGVESLVIGGLTTRLNYRALFHTVAQHMSLHAMETLRLGWAKTQSSSRGCPAVLDWITLFTRAPKLRALHVEGRHASFSFAIALFRALRRTVNQVALPLPELKKLTIEAADLDEVEEEVLGEADLDLYLHSRPLRTVLFDALTSKTNAGVQLDVLYFLCCIARRHEPKREDPRAAIKEMFTAVADVVKWTPPGSYGPYALCSYNMADLAV
jgi:hypothetical protein